MSFIKERFSVFSLSTSAYVSHPGTISHESAFTLSDDGISAAITGVTEDVKLLAEIDLIIPMHCA